MLFVNGNLKQNGAVIKIVSQSSLQLLYNSKKKNCGVYARKGEHSVLMNYCNMKTEFKNCRIKPPLDKKKDKVGFLGIPRNINRISPMKVLY